MPRRFAIPSKRKDYLIGPLLPSQASPKQSSLKSISTHPLPPSIDRSCQRTKAPAGPDFHLRIFRRLHGLRSPEALKRQVSNLQPVIISHLGIFPLCMH
ncbi:hypothetical protein GOBAR_DD08946 [Gossypium barbadense]|nr:hypothetical protein GOBAR_DD08946 [Gossypium barbadense]